MDLINIRNMEHVKTFHCSGPHSCFTSDRKDSKCSKFSEPALAGRYFLLKLQAQHLLSHLAIAYRDMTNVAVPKAIHYDTAFLLLTCVTHSTSIVASIKIFTINNSI